MSAIRWFVCLLALVLVPACTPRGSSPRVVPPAPTAPGGAVAPATPAVPGAAATDASSGAVASAPAAAPSGRVRDPSLLWENDLAGLPGDYECGLREVVTAPGEQDPRVAIWRAYDAARRAVVEGTDEPWADTFVKQFARGQRREWILEQYWPRIKTHIAKYTINSKETAFVICRVEERDGRWKAFVKSFARDKSNPPITVEIEDGTPRIAFFTY